MCKTLLDAALLEKRVGITVKVDPDPCLSMIITPFATTMEISLEKTTGDAFQYKLKRTDDILDTGKVHSSATKDQALFTSSVAECLIDKYEIHDSTSGKVTLVNPTDIPNAILSIDRTTGFTDSLKLRGLNTANSKQADIDLKIVVCGEETITLVDTKTAIIVNELLTSTSTSMYPVTNTDL
jgi:hypothetical protein